MGNEADSLSSRFGLDTSDFKTGLQTANRELRVLKSGFRASVATLGDWANSVSGLELRQKSLTDQIDIQKAKIEALRAEHQRQVEANGDMSKAAQDAEIKLNKETEKLGAMQSELGETETALEGMKSGEQDAGDAADKMADQVEDGGKKVETFKSILSGVGKVAAGVVAGLAAVGGAAIAAVGFVAKIGLDAAATADDLADLSTKTGISTTRLQEMGYAGKILGTDLETITGANARLIRSMASAQEQQAAFDEQLANGKMEDEIHVPMDMAIAFNKLGVSWRDASGNLRDNEDVFADIVDGLGKIKNPAERDALSMQIFGKSAQELNPLIAAGSAGLADLATQAHKVGAVMSEEDVAAGGALQDQLDSITMGFKGVINQIGIGFMPVLSGLAGTAQGYLQDVVGVVQGANGDVGQIATGLGGILGKIATDLAGQLPQLAKIGLGILQSILTALTGALPQLLTAAIAIITSLVNFLVQNLPTLIDAAIQLLLTLVNSIIENLPMLIGAAFQMIITLVQGIAQALPTLIPAIVEMLITVVTTIYENLPMLIKAALQLILALIQGIMIALPILIQAIPQILIAMIDAITETLPMLVEYAPQIILALITGIIGALPALGEAVPQIIETIVDMMNNLLPDILDAGVSIIEGLWKGIQTKLPWFWEQIKSFATGIWDSVAKAIGFGSPATLFFPLGTSIPQGVGVGLAKGIPDLKRQLAGMVSGLTTNLDLALRVPQPAFAAAMPAPIQIGDIIVQLPAGAASPADYGRATELGVIEALRAKGLA